MFSTAVFKWFKYLDIESNDNIIVFIAYFQYMHTFNYKI